MRKILFMIIGVVLLFTYSCSQPPTENEKSFVQSLNKLHTGCMSFESYDAIYLKVTITGTNCNADSIAQLSMRERLLEIIQSV